MYNNPGTMQNPEGFQGELGPLRPELVQVVQGRLQKLLVNERNVENSQSRVPEFLGQTAIQQAKEQDNYGLAA